jgi:hypothetical protein
MKAYKILTKGLKSPYMGFQYELGKEYYTENFGKIGKNNCPTGFYAGLPETLLYRNLSRWPEERVFECEVWGKSVIKDLKSCFEYGIVIREVPFDELKTILKNRGEELGWNLYEALFPIDPRKVERGKCVTNEEITLLKDWSRVGSSVVDSVVDSIVDSAWSSAWSSVGSSVVGSVGSSVWAYFSSLFPNVKNWKYIDHKEGENPFQCGAELWRRGLVPSFDGDVWRLHAGEKMEVVYEIGREELEEK